MKKFAAILALAPVFVTACVATPTKTVVHETAVAQKQVSTQTPRLAGVWIDVRSADEYAKGHLKDTLNIPHSQIGEQIAKFVPNKNTPIHLYCHSGRRAAIAQTVLQDMGYTHVTNQGGYDELVQKGVR